MQVASTTRPLPYMSDRAAELLEEVRAFRARKIPVKSIRLAVGGHQGELADNACIIFYCKGEYQTQFIQHPDDVLAVAPGIFVVQVESAARHVEKMWLIEELTNCLLVRFPMMFVVGGRDCERYHGESTDFNYKDLVSVLKEMASKDFEEEVAPPEPRKHATKAVLLEEIFKAIGVDQGAD